MDDQGMFGRFGRLVGTMYWTTPTAIFFTAIVLMLAAMTVWELASPTVERRGLLPMSTTRGDRLFIGLLGGVDPSGLARPQRPAALERVGRGADLVRSRDALRLKRTSGTLAGQALRPAGDVRQRATGCRGGSGQGDVN